MANIHLISNDELTAKTPLGGNIDVDKYSFIIEETQIFVIEKILGTRLYKKIADDYLNGSISGVYKEILMDYVQPIIIYNVSAEYITIASFHTSNAGIFRYLPENTESVSQRDVDFLANKQRNKADVYVERLQRFLCDGSNDIPEYDNAQENNFDITPDKDINTYGGWRLSEKGYRSSAEAEMWKDIINDEGR